MIIENNQENKRPNPDRGEILALTVKVFGSENFFTLAALTTPIF